MGVWLSRFFTPEEAKTFYIPWDNLIIGKTCKVGKSNSCTYCYSFEYVPLSWGVEPGDIVSAFSRYDDSNTLSYRVVRVDSSHHFAKLKVERIVANLDDLDSWGDVPLHSFESRNNRSHGKHQVAITEDLANLIDEAPIV